MAPHHDMTLFWVILALVVLFVVGSASALRYFGPGRRDNGKQKGRDR